MDNISLLNLSDSLQLRNKESSCERTKEKSTDLQKKNKLSKNVGDALFVCKLQSSNRHTNCTLELRESLSSTTQPKDSIHYMSP